MTGKLFVALLAILSASIFPFSAYCRGYYNDYYDGPDMRGYYDNGGYAPYYDDDYYYRRHQAYYDDGSYYHSSRHHHRYQRQYYSNDSYYSGQSYSSRMPDHITTSEKTILVDPRVHAWGAYTASGDLVRAGLVTAGSRWCPDLRRPCRTRAGTFRIYSLGSFSCKSHKFPLPHGGARMPYCMYFNGGQGLHGSYEVVEGNVSHGCVRMHVSDAEWLRFNFANVGTKVVIRPYY